ncbi:MAG: hypothetical protein ABI895_07110 [Deltaproteobacteria bacterium]
MEPVLIAARRPDSPLLKNGFHTVIASAEPKRSRRSSVYLSDAFASGSRNDVQSPVIQSPVIQRPVIQRNGHAVAADELSNGVAKAAAREDESEVVDASSAAAPGALAGGAVPAELEGAERPNGAGRVDVRRRVARIVKAAEHAAAPDNREQRLLERLMRSQGRVAISRAADELWESKFKAPRQQAVQIQLLEHENEHRARDAVFVMAELLQRESPVQRPVLDQRLRRLEEFAEDPITRDAARALRRSMRVHHGM